MFISIGIQDDHRWSPFDTEPVDEGLILIKIDLERNKTLFDCKNDIRIRIGNSFQLLTPNSEVVIKIHQDQFLLLL